MNVEELAARIQKISSQTIYSPQDIMAITEAVAELAMVCGSVAEALSLFAKFVGIVAQEAVSESMREIGMESSLRGLALRATLKPKNTNTFIEDKINKQRANWQKSRRF